MITANGQTCWSAVVPGCTVHLSCRLPYAQSLKWKLLCISEDAVSALRDNGHDYGHRVIHVMVPSGSVHFGPENDDWLEKFIKQRKRYKWQYMFPFFRTFYLSVSTTLVSTGSRVLGKHKLYSLLKPNVTVVFMGCLCLWPFMSSNVWLLKLKLNKPMEKQLNKIKYLKCIIS